MTTTATTRRDWSEHDAQIPFRCPVMFRRNGTNKAGRRPHSLMEPQRLQAANDNRVATGEVDDPLSNVPC